MSYCRNCGNALGEQGAFCPTCGVPPPRGNGFCQHCGRATDPLAEICVGCGVRLAQQQTRQASGGGGKSKTASVLLAVFLGFFTWLYTYRADGWKFWVGSAVFVITIISAVAEESLPLWVTSLIFVAGPCVGIWAIVDAAVKPGEWYRNYSAPSPGERVKA